MDLGFSEAGFNVTTAIEADKDAYNTYVQNHSNVALNETIDENTTLKTNIDVIFAGPPCQGFSTVGKNVASDPRNSLLPLTCKLAVKSAPRIIVIENVSGLLNKQNRPILDEAVSILRSNGYFVNYKILKCEQLGVPQRRRRLFIIARSNNEAFTFPDNFDNSEKKYLKNVLQNIPTDDKFHNPVPLAKNSKAKFISLKIKQGEKLSNVRASANCVHSWQIPKAFGRTTILEREVLNKMVKLRRQNRKRKTGDADPVSISNLQTCFGQQTSDVVRKLIKKGFLRASSEGAIDLTNTFNGKYRRLEWEGFSPTVDTRFGEHRLFLHPLEDRGLTVREAARIQGFPDDFVFPDNTRIAYRQIGNAVPPPVARNVASFVRELV